MLNKKGFTLIELLATIVIVGIVLSIGTYFVLNVIENSKEKAFELSKKSVLESAVIYANEFLDETDWVPSKDEGDINVEKSCVSVQWLINKGSQKKKDFNLEGENDKYKLNIDDVVVLKKDTISKKVTFDDIYSSNKIDNKTCNNLFVAEIMSTSSTTQSITVNGKCSVKDIIPNDVTYEYCIDNKCESGNNVFTKNELSDNTEFKVLLKCHSTEFGYAEMEPIVLKTNLLPEPTINVDSTTTIIDFRNSDNNITKTYKVSGDNVKDNIRSSTYLVKDKDYNSTKSNVYLYTGKITEVIQVTATNFDGYNTKSIKRDVDPVLVEVNKPSIRTDDGILSGNWHNDDFILFIESDNDSTVYYEYKIDKEVSYKTSSGTIQIPISEENKSLIYVARACKNVSGSGKVCSDLTSYEVKLDKTAPNLVINVRDTDNANIINEMTCNDDDNECSNSNWLNKKISFDVSATDTGSGLENDYIDFKYSISGSSSLGELTGSSTIENNSSKNIYEDGNRQYQFEICDVVGNCTVKDYYLKTDTTSPTVGVSMGYTGSSGSSISLSIDGDSYSNDTWHNKYVTLYFTANDSLSGLNNDAKFSYNYGYNSEFNDSIMGTDNVDLSSGTFTRTITSDGNRYVTFNVCDNTNNCVTKKIKFKIDTIVPYIYIDNNNNKLTINCNPSFSGVKIFNLYDNIANVRYPADDENATSNSFVYNPSTSNVNLRITCRNNAENYINKDYIYSSTTSPPSDDFCDVTESATCCLNYCKGLNKSDRTGMPWKGIFNFNKCYCCDSLVTDISHSNGHCLAIG